MNKIINKFNEESIAKSFDNYEGISGILKICVIFIY